MGSGKRVSYEFGKHGTFLIGAPQRIEHYLENLPRGGDWREFCATTPARFHELEFSGAQECFQQVRCELEHV